MQKKKALTKSTTTEETKIVTPEGKKKDLSRSLSFFAIFIICVGGAMLYPYFKQERSFHLPAQSMTAEDTSKNFQPVEPEFIEQIQEEDIEETEPVKETEIKETEQVDCSSRDLIISSQEKTIENLNEKIHQLELENLSLKEKTSLSQRAILLNIQLLEKIHTGQPFDSILGRLLKENPSDDFASEIQEKLGPCATNGILPPEKLKQLFHSKIKMVQDSFYAGNPNDSWNQKLMNFFKSLFHIYPQNVAKGDIKPDNLLFLIRQQVEAGQFEQAIANIKKLPDPAKQHLKDFVQKATYYIEAQKIIEDYTQEGD